MDPARRIATGCTNEHGYEETSHVVPHVQHGLSDTRDYIPVGSCPPSEHDMCRARRVEEGQERRFQQPANPWLNHGSPPFAPD